MGYTTDFTGRLTFADPLTPAQTAYVRQFNETRRMRRDAKAVEKLFDPLRLAAGLYHVGDEGGYFVGTGDRMASQDRDGTVLDSNEPPDGQPGLWCRWTVTEDGRHLEWDGGEKFYSYVEWLEYLTAHFFRPWGKLPNGTIEWSGEEQGDVGTITVLDGKVTVVKGRVVKGKVDRTDPDEGPLREARLLFDRICWADGYGLAVEDESRVADYVADLFSVAPGDVFDDYQKADEDGSED